MCFCINRLYHRTEHETEVISSAVRLRNSGYTGGGQTNLCLIFSIKTFLFYFHFIHWFPVVCACVVFSPSSSSEKMEYCHSFFPWRSWRLNHNMRREKKWLNGSEQIYAAKKKRMFLKCLSHLLLTFLKKEPKQINYLILKKRHK